MRRRRTPPLTTLVAVAALAWLVCACVGTVSDHGPDPEGCEAYSTRDCECASGETGSQQCRTDRTWGDCECEGNGKHDLLCASGACEDSSSGLFWQQSPSGQVFSWAEARYYCDELVLGAREDWRMPGLDDLRTLIRGCPGSEPAGGCSASGSCLEPRCAESCLGCTWNEGPGEGGCYWPPELKGNCWSYWSVSLLTGSVTDAWHVVFDNAKVEYKATDDLNQVRCIRGP